MKCYLCSTQEGIATEAVATCRFCGVALCVRHHIEAVETTQGGMRYTCNHTVATAEGLESAKQVLERLVGWPSDVPVGM